MTAQQAQSADVAKAHFAAHPGAMGSFERYRIGPFDVALRSELDEAACDFAHLYRDCHQGSVSADGLDRSTQYVIEAERRSSFWGRPRFAVLGDREEIFVGRGRAEVLPYLEWAVNWRVMARAHAYCQLHAATLSWRGQGVLFAAGSGSGKSTLAAGAMAAARREAGWRLLSDEFALIRRQTLELMPFAKALCIKAGSFSIVRGLGLPLFARRHYAKATKGRVGFVTPADLPGEAVGRPCPVRAVFFPQYMGDATPAAEPLSRAEAVVRLSEMIFNRHHLGPTALEILSAVVAGARCWQLTTGCLESTLDLVQSLVEPEAGRQEEAQAAANQRALDDGIVGHAAA